MYTPFRVKVIEDVEDLKKGVYVYVEEVACTQEGKLIYMIDTGAYLQSSFRIVASF